MDGALPFEHAGADWLEIGESLGLDLQQFTCTPISQRAGAIVLRLEAGGRPVYALKVAHDRAAARRLLRAADGQSLAAADLAGNPACSVAQVVAVSEQPVAMLTRWVPGVTLAEALEAARLDADMRAQALHRAGSWLAVWHGQSVCDGKPFAPAWHRKRLKGLGRALGTGELALPRPNLFRKFLRLTIRKLEAAADTPLRAGRLHGAFRCEHLIVAGETATAISFRPRKKTVPLAADVAEFLADFAATQVPASELRAGRFLSADDREAFFGAYGWVDAEDPVLDAMTHAHLCAHWAKIPADPDQRSFADQHRLRGLRAIAEGALAQVRALS